MRGIFGFRERSLSTYSSPDLDMRYNCLESLCLSDFIINFFRMFLFMTSVGFCGFGISNFPDFAATLASGERGEKTFPDGQRGQK